jgi:hypothetical protein
LTQLFNRQISFIVADASGQGLELSGTPPLTSTGTQPLFSGFHITFRVTHWDSSTPNSLTLRIYNLSDETAQQIRKEFVQVILRAGYPGNFGIIFKGTIQHINKGAVNSDLMDLDGVRSGNENATDTYLDVFASDGDEAYNWGIINTTLAAGYTPKEVNAVLGQAMFLATTVQGADGTKFVIGELPDSIPQPAAPRGKVMFGMARDHAHVLSRTNAMSWSINGGVLQWLPFSAYRPGEAVVLTSRSGLIGVPQQTDQGIAVRTLLNPALGAGTRLQINNKSIMQAPQSQAYHAFNALPSISEDGFYKILYVDHYGDTRGQEWYSDCICLAIDGTILPMTESVLGVPIPP